MIEDERRQGPRYDATEVAARLAFNQPLRLLDLGFGGASLETHEWLAPGRRYLLRLGDAGLQLGVVVVHCTLARVEPGTDGTRPVYAAGVELEPMSSAARAQLARLLGALARQDAPAPPLQLAAAV